MKVFLAGATGAIGRRLVPQLVEAGHEVTAMTRSKEKLGMLYDLGAEAVACDVYNAGRLGSVVARAEPDAVINELTDLPQSLNPRRLKEYYAANNRVRREGTANLLSAARGAGVRRFLVQGAAYWYAPTGGPVKTEEAPLYLDAPSPIGPAVETIKEVEEAVLTADGIEGIVLRYGMFYGPGTWYAKDGDIGRQVRKRRYPMIGHGEGTGESGYLQRRRRRTSYRRSVDASLCRGAGGEAAAAGSCVRRTPDRRRRSRHVDARAQGCLQREDQGGARLAP
jgi:nucleoside-diphosphate-sugar epimerase